MRKLHLQRDTDISGVSGTGRVAEGIQFYDGVIVLKWNTKVSSMAIYNSLDDLITIVGHQGATQVIWDE